MSGLIFNTPSESITYNDLDLSKKLPSVRVAVSSQSIANNTATNLSFNTEYWDSDNFWTSGTDIIIPAGLGGIYLITCTTSISVGAGTWVGEAMGQYLYINDVLFLSRFERVRGTFYGASVNMSYTYPLNAGDEINLRGYQATGASRNMFGEIGLVRLGPK